MIGAGALCCVLGMVVFTVAGSLAAGTRLSVVAVPLAIVALLLSVGAVVLGVIALTRASGRIPGIVAVALGVLLKPALLALLLPGAPR